MALKTFFLKLWHFRLYGQKLWHIRRLPLMFSSCSPMSAAPLRSSFGGFHPFLATHHLLTQPCHCCLPSDCQVIQALAKPRLPVLSFNLQACQLAIESPLHRCQRRLCKRAKAIAARLSVSLGRPGYPPPFSFALWWALPASALGAWLARGRCFESGRGW
jgi:hypothetical protein